MFNTKNLRLLAALLALYCIYVHAGIPVAEAAPSVSAQLGADSLGLDVAQFQSTLAMINTFMHILLLLTLNMLQFLLQADFFNDSSMMASLNSIWVLSRNIMNMIFALMLIGVALYTIITAKSELIKSKISQFVIAVILVNFSWFFPRVIIDIANTLTATVYSIPDMLQGGTWQCKKYDGKPCTVIADILIFPSNEKARAWFSDPSGICSPLLPKPNECECDNGHPFSTEKDPQIGCWAITEWPGKKLGKAHAMINGMASSFINIEGLTKLPPSVAVDRTTSLSTFSTTLQIMANLLMVFIVQVGTLLALIGLAVGLLVRIVILWITIAFMPFTFLGYVINGKLGTNIFGFETDIWKEFINAAFLPAVVGIPITIGFIMLGTVASTNTPPGFPLYFGVPPLQGIPTWWNMLWMFAAVGIIYTGAFAALARSKITGQITGKIKGFGDSLARIGLSAPLLAPLPVPIGGATNLGQAVNKIAQLQSKINKDTGMGTGVGGVHVDSSKVNVEAVKMLKTLPNEVANLNTQLQTMRGNAKGSKEYEAAYANITSKVGGGSDKKQTLQQFKAHINSEKVTGIRGFDDLINANP